VHQTCCPMLRFERHWREDVAFRVRFTLLFTLSGRCQFLDERVGTFTLRAAPVPAFDRVLNVMGKFANEQAMLTYVYCSIETTSLILIYGKQTVIVTIGSANVSRAIQRHLTMRMHTLGRRRARCSSRLAPEYPTTGPFLRVRPYDCLSSHRNCLDILPRFPP
jgi:hypothetical protein